MDYRIWANHAHVFPENVKPGGEISKLRELTAECGIEKTVCFTCFNEQFERSGLSGDSNLWLYGEIKNDPSLIGFGTIDFTRNDITEQVKRIASYGFKGIKIHPAFQEVNIMGEKPRLVYETAQELGLFLSFHTGIHWHRISDYNVLLFDEVAFNYPELKFSMEHIGGYHFFRDALAVMCNAKRNAPFDTVFAGWTSISPDDNGLCSNWTITDEELRTVINQTGNSRSIFGLDFPYNDANETKQAIERIKGLDISDEAKTGVLGKNLCKALGMSWD